MCIRDSYKTVDTCSAEFSSETPYHYSSYEESFSDNRLQLHDNEVHSDKNNFLKKIMILGGGPNRIGQGIEFDYCCCHASYQASNSGYQTIMVNSNPETVSTDYDTSDILYFEPVTLEDVLNIIENYCQSKPLRRTSNDRAFQKKTQLNKYRQFYKLVVFLNLFDNFLLR